MLHCTIMRFNNNYLQLYQTKCYRNVTKQLQLCQRGIFCRRSAIIGFYIQCVMCFVAQYRKIFLKLLVLNFIRSSIPDPKDLKPEEFDRVRDMIENKVKDLVEKVRRDKGV